MKQKLTGAMDIMITSLWKYSYYIIHSFIHSYWTFI